MRPDRTPNPELDPLFLSAKALDDVPDAARDRALGRARAIVAAPPRAAATPPRRFRLALAAAGVIAIGATGALAALFRAPPRAPAVAPEAPVVARPEMPAAAAPAPPPALEEPAAPRIHVSHRRVSAAGELELIQGAQSSYADGNLPAALRLLAEHARRFPHGRLAQEREALRVRSLARSGRAAEARAAFQAFAARFPDSVLLPHLRETLASPAGDAP